MNRKDVLGGRLRRFQKLEEVKMRKYLVLAGLFLIMGSAAIAQDYPVVETSPSFAYQRNGEVFGGSQNFNCAGGGGTFAYNVSSVVGIAADLNFCKVFGLNNTYGVGSKVNGSEQTFVFGPRFTYRSSSMIQPFFEVNVGGERIKLSCNTGDAGNACGSGFEGTLPPGVNPSATSFSKTAFAMTVGGGMDIKVSKKLAIRLFQAEYLYTRFGNNCAFAICNNANRNQNSFRLKSGIVIAWGSK
jgi:opacity protein-like surface antigen